MEAMMDRVTVCQMEVRGSCRRHTKSPGCPRNSSRHRQAPMRLRRATKVRDPPEAYTRGVDLCLRNNTSTEPWDSSSRAPDSIISTDSILSQDSTSNVGSTQDVLRRVDHWPFGHGVHRMSSFLAW